MAIGGMVISLPRSESTLRFQLSVKEVLVAITGNVPDPMS